MLRCARFPEVLQNFSEHQILWSLVGFHALTLKLPIQTSLSVAPKLPVCVRSGEKFENFSKMSTALGSKACKNTTGCISNSTEKITKNQNRNRNKVS